MSDTLKPCPFCGGDANTIGERYWWDVECLNCGVQSTNEYESEHLAIKAWNIRQSCWQEAAEMVNTELEIGHEPMVHEMLLFLRNAMEAKSRGKDKEE